MSEQFAFFICSVTILKRSFLKKKLIMSEENINQEEQTTTQSETPKGSEGVNVVAVLSYIGILCLIPLLTAKEDEFAQFHAKQGLVLLIAGVIGMVIGAVPVIGWLLAPFITLAWLIFSIIGIINVVKKEKKELPLIGQYAQKINI